MAGSEESVKGPDGLSPAQVALMANGSVVMNACLLGALMQLEVKRLVSGNRYLNRVRLSGRVRVPAVGH